MSKEAILDRVDEFSLYLYYTGIKNLDVGLKVSSPIRNGDFDPSFALYDSNNGIYWRDYATGEYGDVFNLIKILYNLPTHYDTLKQIVHDFELDEFDGCNKPKIILKERVKKEKKTINVINRAFKPSDLIYWEKQGISRPTLRKYNTEALYSVTIGNYTFYPRQSYSYQIEEFYKIYSPFEEKKLKFRNNLPTRYIEGLNQLSYTTDTLIITKSLKECMWFYENMGIEAVAGKSETTMVAKEFIEYFKTKYKRIITFLDPDATGIKFMSKYKEYYGLSGYTILPCRFTFGKDPTDNNNLYGRKYTKELIEVILNNTPIV